MRTPALVSSKRLFGSEGPRRVSGVMHASDWLPTLMEAANQSRAEDGKKTQGQSQWKFWTSNGAAVRYKEFYIKRALSSSTTEYRNETLLELNAALPRIAIRVGDMKLVVGKSSDSAGDWSEPPENTEDDITEDKVECEEDNTNFAGYGIEGNKVFNYYNEYFSVKDNMNI